MGFPNPFRRTQVIYQVQEESELNREIVDTLPYAIEFDWQTSKRAWDKLEAIYDHQSEGGTFVIRKSRGHKDSKHGPVVWELDHFPTYDELFAEVEEDYGGGTYNVYMGLASSTIAKSYQVPGSSRGTPGNNKKAPATDVKETMRLQAWNGLQERMAENPGMADAIYTQMLAKELGIKGVNIGARTIEEQELQEALDEDPEFKRQFRESLLRKRGLKKQGEMSELDTFISSHKKMKELNEAIGAGDKDSGWNILKELGAEFFKNNPGLVQSITKPADQVALPAPQPTPQPQPQPVPQYNPQPESPPMSAPVPMPMTSVPETNQVISQAEEGSTMPIPGINLPADVNWTTLLPQLDWVEIERGIDGSPLEFMQHVFVQANNRSTAHEVLADLFVENEPASIIQGLIKAKENLTNLFARAVVQGLGVDFDTAVRVVDKLITPEGQQWIFQARYTALHIQSQAEQVDTPSAEDPRPVVDQENQIPDLTLPVSDNHVNAPVNVGGDPFGFDDDDLEDDRLI